MTFSIFQSFHIWCFLVSSIFRKDYLKIECIGHWFSPIEWNIYFNKISMMKFKSWSNYLDNFHWRIWYYKVLRVLNFGNFANFKLTSELNICKITLFWWWGNLISPKFFKIFKNFVTFQYVYFPEFFFSSCSHFKVNKH